MIVSAGCSGGLLSRFCFSRLLRESAFLCLSVEPDAGSTRAALKPPTKKPRRRQGFEFGTLLGVCPRFDPGSGVPHSSHKRNIRQEENGGEGCGPLRELAYGLNGITCRATGPLVGCGGRGLRLLTFVGVAGLVDAAVPRLALAISWLRGVPLAKYTWLRVWLP